MLRTSRILPVLSILATLAVGVGTSHANEKPKVVVSLAPLEFLVHAVAGDQVDTATLVPPGASPHTYQLRPSERRQLATADLIFWVGPGMENFLERLLTGADLRDQSVALMPVSGGSGEGHSHEAHRHRIVEDDHHDREHKHEQRHGHDDGHGHGDGEDPHIWLDPALALEMAEAMTHHLADLDGLDREQLEQNLAAFSAALAGKQNAIREQLQSAKHLALFTYHDAFRRFAEHYGLTIAGVLTLSPERTPGARHLAEVQQTLQQARQACLLTEPQFNRQWWDALLNEVTIPISTWDALASAIPPSAAAYLEFQQSLADAVLGCLPENTQQ